MRFLLDTHVLLWVSAISALEISTKQRLGKLQGDDVATTLPAWLSRLGVTQLSVSWAHATLAGTMQWSHRDPFDRVLVAQATLEDLVLVTVDAALQDLPVPRILTW